MNPAPFEDMHYVYILKSIKYSGKLYIGYTGNIIKRLKEHNSGKTFSTKKYMPWKVVYLEGYANQDNATHREKQIKHFGKVYKQLKLRIRHSLQS